MKIVCRVLLIMLISAGLLACENNEPQETVQEHAEKHMDPTYVCPMHPSVVSDEPGDCPICGMQLVEKTSSASTENEEQEILYYRHPHDPQVTSPTPAKDEMGMDFIPVHADPGGVVALDSATIQALGVRTDVVERGRLWRRVDSVGYVSYDDTTLRHIHPRVEGWIEELRVHQVGERVNKGDLLFTLYSPALVTAQEEFVGALASGNQRLINASRERLQALNVADKDIARLERERKVMQNVPFYAERDEIVAALNVREGMFVESGLEVMTLADISRVWLRAEIFDRQAAWVKPGQPAEATLSFLPGKEFEGTVEFVSPILDPVTRTVEARLSFANPEGELKPNMFADVQIYGGPKQEVLYVPREALIRTSDGGRLVMAVAEGRFSVREVVPGLESGDYVEILAGVEEGEQVVTSAQFLIDSEASLKAGLQRLDSGEQQ